MLLYRQVHTILLLLPLLFLNVHCSAQPAQSTISPKGYNLQQPQIIKLGKEINEISGVAYYKPENVVFAIDDNHGDIFKVPLKEDPKIDKWRFAKDNDFEDIVLLDQVFYLLSSEGSIYSVPFSGKGEVKKKKANVSGKNDFESLFFHPGKQRLVMLCKACSDDKKSENTFFEYDVTKGDFTKKSKLKVKEIEKVLGSEIGRFKPSAANYNQFTNEIYIISSVNKLLVVTDSSFGVKQVFKLDPQLFKQPEGLCFTDDRTLIISNEAAGDGKAKLLIFKYKR